MPPSPSHAAMRAANRRGIAAMVLSAVCFVSNDALFKYATQSIPVGQAIFMRAVVAVILLLAVAHALGATRHLRRLGDRRMSLRSVLDAMGTILYLTALSHLPLGNATAINMAAPLFIIMFAVLVLHERATVARWAALSVGFAGVLLIVQPAAAGFSAWALVSVCGTLLHASRDLVTRMVDKGIPSILLTLSTAASVGLLGGVVSIFQGWQPFGLATFVQLSVGGVLLSAGHYFLIVSMRGGEISLIAPFRYSGLLTALLIGFFVWGDVPNLLAWGGITLLVGAGLYVLYSERARQREMLETAGD